MTDSNGDEAGAQRADEEPLLVPMPTQRAEHRSAAPSESITTSLPTTETGLQIPTTLLFSAALAIVILVAGLVVILRRFR